MKAEWRSVYVTCGELCVMTPGEALMLLWCVDSWDTQQKVPLFIATAEEVHFGFQILYVCVNRCSCLHQCSFW